MTFVTQTNFDFIQNGRQLEVEAMDRGRRSNEISIEAFEDVALGAEDDVQETEERLETLAAYLPYVERAYRERDLAYPFCQSAHGDSLEVLSGREGFAADCAALSDVVGRDNAEHGVAKEFEKRAVAALHTLVGGWAVCVGFPRRGKTGPKRGVRQFRELLQAERGDYFREKYPPSGDLKADAFWILGRRWGGPLLYFQARNSQFSPELVKELPLMSDALNDWFGRRINQRRIVLPVYAINTVLTLEVKEHVFEAAATGHGYHILDAVDILYAETRDAMFVGERDTLLFL